jgi:hypothetical protein
MNSNTRKSLDKCDVEQALQIYEYIKCTPNIHLLIGELLVEIKTIVDTRIKEGTARNLNVQVYGELVSDAFYAESRLHARHMVEMFHNQQGIPTPPQNAGKLDNPLAKRKGTNNMNLKVCFI